MGARMINPGNGQLAAPPNSTTVMCLCRLYGIRQSFDRRLLRLKMAFSLRLRSKQASTMFQLEWRVDERYGSSSYWYDPLYRYFGMPFCSRGTNLPYPSRKHQLNVNCLDHWLLNYHPGAIKNPWLLSWG